MIVLTTDPIDADAIRRAVRGPENGAVLVFLGTVRDQSVGRRVTHLEYEAYEPMARRELERLAAEVVATHSLSALACAHRLGRLAIGDDALVVAASAPHRGPTLAAVADFIARLKRDVPIWKKEVFEGGAVWVGSPDDPQGERSAPHEAPA